MNTLKLMSGRGESHWSERAVCKGDERFTLPARMLAQHADIQEMEKICARCPVFEDCYDWALLTDANGVFAAGVYRRSYDD